MRGTALLFAGMLLLALWVLTRHWNQPILDRHEFRQLQTALSTYWLRADGFRLAYPLPLFGPPWSAPLEFPLYQACVAGLSGTFHLPLEQTGRAVGIAIPPGFSDCVLCGACRGRVQPPRVGIAHQNPSQGYLLPSRNNAAQTQVQVVQR